jgi:hypothetical protein
MVAELPIVIGEVTAVVMAGLALLTVTGAVAVGEAAWVASPLYVAPMLWVPVPTAVGVYVTVQVAWFVPSAVRVGHGLALKAPDPLVVNETVPVGFVAPVVAVSVTVAVHELATPTVTGEVHKSAVDVGSFVATVCTIVAAGVWIASRRVVPNASSTRTHVSAGEATLLVAQAPKPDGQVRGVLAAALTTWYMIVNAKPEHGPIPPHSLLPEASAVVTSTTPGPFGEATAVQEPVPAGGEDEPLMQIEVKDGDAIKVPSFAVTGFKTAGLDWT